MVLYRKSVVKLNESCPERRSRSLPNPRKSPSGRLQLASFFCTSRINISKREEQGCLRAQLAVFGRFFVMLPPSRTILMPLLLKMVVAAAALVLFCAAAEAAINPKHGNRVVSMHLRHISLFIYPHCPCASRHSLLQVQVCRLQSPPPPTPADAVLAPFLPSMSLYTFEVPLLLFSSCCTRSRPHPSPRSRRPTPVQETLRLLQRRSAPAWRSRSASRPA